MGAPPGNQFWKARSRHGRKPLFESADALWEACCEYFEWVEENPLYEEKVFCYQGEITRTKLAKARPMTLGGLCLFLGINDATWRGWRQDGDENGFGAVIKKADKIIYEQKFAGAAADLFNANIIARDLGLTDKTEVKQSVAAKVSADMSPQDAANAYQDLMNG